MQPPKMPAPMDQKKRIRKRLSMRHFFVTGDLDASRAFDQAVCDVLGIDAEADPPTFLTDPQTGGLPPA